METLKNNQAKEQHVLSDRLVRADTAHTLAQNPIASFRRIDLMRYMLILQDDIDDFRVDTLTSVVLSLSTGNLETVVKELCSPTPPESAASKLASFVDCMCLWRGSEDVPAFDADQPTLRPLVTKLLAQGAPADSDVDDLLKLQSKTDVDDGGEHAAGAGSDDVGMKSSDELWEDWVLKVHCNILQPKTSD